MLGGTNSAMVINSLGAGGVTEAAHQLLRRIPPSGGARRLYVLKQPGPGGNADRLHALGADGITVTFGAGHNGKIASIAHLASWLEQERIALLHTHSFRPNLYARLAGVLHRGNGLRLLAHYHNQYDDKWPDGSDALLLERQLANQTDAMIAVSDAVRDHVASALRKDPSAICVVENGVNLERIAGGTRDAVRREFGLSCDHVVVGLIGRVCQQKGQQDLIAAAKHLASRQPNLRYLLVGDHEDKDLSHRLRGEVSAAGLGDVVYFTGFRRDMANVYAALDILAAPSRWEGFGLMLVEAMAVGVPIVATNVGAIPDVLDGGRSGLLVEPQQPAGLAEAIIRLVEEPALRRALVGAGQIRARRYSWEQSARRIADLHAAVIAAPRISAPLPAAAS